MTAGFVWPLNGPKGFSHPVFRDNNSPAYRSDALRAYLATPGLRLGIKAMVRRRWGDFFTRLACRREEFKRCCRTLLQARAEKLTGSDRIDFHHPGAHNIGYVKSFVRGFR